MEASVATERIWDEFHGRLLCFIRRRVDSEADAEDILQDVFASVHAHVDGLRDSDSVTSWVHRIARNRIIDHHRARARQRGLSDGAASDPSVAPTRVEDDAVEDDGAARADLARCIEPLLGRLTPEFAEAVRLTELAGETQAAAAKTLGLSVSGMKSRVQRGRRKLKDALTDCCRVHLDARKAVVGYEPRTPGQSVDCCTDDSCEPSCDR